MRFYDQVDIIVQSGKGGDGLVSARKEAGVPMGGPNGGNGGQGGSVILVADQNLNTLLHLKYQKVWKAKDGNRGERTDKYGRGAEDLILKVPVGTIVKEYEKTSDIDDIYDHQDRSEITDTPPYAVFQLVEHGQSYVICKGGSGGVGNMHFKNSTVQYPDFALLGEPGQKKHIQIELQILADVGLIGFPSVGKSSIINSICQTKAKVAEYHFTTLVPNLGSVKAPDIDFNIIDIPGIIEGASTGKGLGNEFLRHILKCRVFCFVLDAGRYDDGMKEFGILFEEFVKYIKNRFEGSDELGIHIDKVGFDIKMESDYIKFIIYQDKDNQKITLMEKNIFRLVNKSDLMEDSEIREEYKSHLIDSITKVLQNIPSTHISISKNIIDKNILFYNTIIKEGVDKLLYFLQDILKNNQSNLLPWFESIDIDHKKESTIELVGDITDEDMIDLLRHHGYNIQDNKTNLPTKDEENREENIIDTDEDKNDLQPSRVPKIWKVYDPEFCRLTYQMMRGKILAEQWFRKVMKKNHTINRFIRNGVKYGDFLVVDSDYDIPQKKIIRFEI